MTTATYSVEGMMCGDCVNKVHTAVDGIDSVEGVQVDLESGTVTVTGNQPPAEVVHAAITDAGFRVVG